MVGTLGSLGGTSLNLNTIISAVTNNVLSRSNNSAILSRSGGNVVSRRTT